MSLKTVRQKFHDRLDPIYGINEVSALFDLCCEQYLSLNKVDQLISIDRILSSAEIDKLDHVIGKLEIHRPIQYEIGHAYFYGLTLIVNESVLIPRQETEELVSWVLEDYPLNTQLSLLDLCTGSGCIALAIKSSRPNFRVIGADISEAALIVANKNASRHALDVSFKNQDVLSLDFSDHELYDVIVSNPPYVLELEKSLMGNNVLNFEPHIALFVPNDNPLLFYLSIATYASKALKVGGTLYFEINENQGTEMIAMLENIGFDGVVLKKDLNGKDRIIKCLKRNA